MEILEASEQLVDRVLKPNVDARDENDPGFEYDRYDEEEKQGRLPKDAREVAYFTGEVENWTSWDQESYYYVCAIPDVEGGYVLLCLDWDDNWGRWQWTCCSALNGATSASKAKKLLLQDYARRNYDPEIDDEWNDFLKQWVGG